MSSSTGPPKRHGKPWPEEEIISLLKLIQKKKSLEEIATHHERSIGGIKSRLRGIAADYYFNDKYTIEDIEKYTGLTASEIEDSINRRKAREHFQKTPVEVKNTSKSDEIILLLKEISSKLTLLLEK